MCFIIFIICLFLYFYTPLLICQGSLIFILFYFIFIYILFYFSFISITEK